MPTSISIGQNKTIDTSNWGMADSASWQNRGFGASRARYSKSAKKAEAVVTGIVASPSNDAKAAVGHEIELQDSPSDSDDLEITVDGDYKTFVRLVGETSGTLRIGVFVKRPEQKMTTTGVIDYAPIVNREKSFEDQVTLENTFSELAYLNGSMMEAGDVFQIGVYVLTEISAVGYASSVVDAFGKTESPSGDEYVGFDSINLTWD